jgi:hypothetical protein
MRQFRSELKAKDGQYGELRQLNKWGVAPVMVILRLKMICYCKGLKEKNAHKTEFWIKSVERDTLIKQRAKPLPTAKNYHNKIISDDEDVIDKRRKMLISGFLLMKLC